MMSNSKVRAKRQDELAVVEQLEALQLCWNKEPNPLPKRTPGIQPVNRLSSAGVNVGRSDTRQGLK